LKGNNPSRDQITDLSEELNLKENQIYKWFWDTKKKVEEDTRLAKSMGHGPYASNNGKLIHTDEFGGYSKTWKNNQAGNESMCLGVEGKDGHGEMLTPQQIKTALKINQDAQQREAEFESIAMQLGLDIEKTAFDLVNAPSPRGKRQVVRKIRPDAQ